MADATPLVETDSKFISSFKKLLTVIDQLRDAGLNEHISLPRVAVLGTQSAGKSSLLESIVGLNFLPRGDVSHWSDVGSRHEKTFRIEIEKT